MPAYIRRVTVDEIILCDRRNDFSEISTNKFPVILTDRIGHIFDLVRDFGDIGFGKPLRLMPKRNIEAAFFVEAHYAIEAGAIQKEHIQWVTIFIKALAYFIIMIFAFGLKVRAFFLQKFFSNSCCYFSMIDGIIKINDVRIYICKNSAAWTHVKSNHARTHEWLNPYTVVFEKRMVFNPFNQFCFNSLTFQGRDFYSHFCTCLLFLRDGFLTIGFENFVSFPR